MPTETFYENFDFVSIRLERMKNFVQFGKCHHDWIGCSDIMFSTDAYLIMLYSIVFDEHLSITSRRKKFNDVCFINKDLFESFFGLHQNEYKKQMLILELHMLATQKKLTEVKKTHQIVFIFLFNNLFSLKKLMLLLTKCLICLLTFSRLRSLLDLEKRSRHFQLIQKLTNEGLILKKRYCDKLLKQLCESII